MGMDEFDALHLAYLLQRRDSGRIRGCVRLLPSTGPTMLGKTFAALLDGAPPPADSAVWESSRLFPCRSRFRRSEEHRSELQSLMRISYAVCCSKQKTRH